MSPSEREKINRSEREERAWKQARYELEVYARYLDDIDVTITAGQIRMALGRADQRDRLVEAAALALDRLDALAITAPGDEYERTLEVASRLERVLRECRGEARP